MRVIAKDGKNKYGLNFNLLSMKSRDRADHLPESSKLLHTFLTWHVELLSGNRKAAQLLYDVLLDSDSLEARAFKCHAISESGATLLAKEFLVRHPGNFPILDTDYDGHALVTKKLKKTAVNLKESLYSVMSPSPLVESPEKAWETLKQELARSSRHVPWTPEYSLAATIVQQLLSTDTQHVVLYKETDPGWDVELKWTGHVCDNTNNNKNNNNNNNKFIVGKVQPGGPAAQAGVSPGCQLVRLNDINLKDWCPRPHGGRAQSLMSVARNGSARSSQSLLPIRACFRETSLDLCTGQFRLVCQDDVDVPVVAIFPPAAAAVAGQQEAVAHNNKSTCDSDAASRLRSADFIVNKAACCFHDDVEGDFSDCSYKGQGVCFCGVDQLFSSLVDELKRNLGIKFSRAQDRRIGAMKMQLLNKHRKVFQNAQQRRKAESKDKAAGGSSRQTRASPEEADIERVCEMIVEKCSEDRTEELDAEERRILQIAEHLAAKLDEEKRRKTKAHDPQAAWLGDRLNDSYVALRGTAEGLSPHQMDQIRQRELSSKGLAGDMGRAVAEDVEAQVGQAAKKLGLAAIAELLAVRTPQQGLTVHERLEEAVRKACLGEGVQQPARLKPRRGRASRANAHNNNNNNKKNTFETKREERNWDANEEWDDNNNKWQGKRSWGESDRWWSRNTESGEDWNNDDNNNYNNNWSRGWIDSEPRPKRARWKD
ncbi:unnamed protein product [Polarella glacialis]|uniref:Uncharacterized protein n=1 Tax=Polarella glacialis TaxID=89957 RepID=A0A813M0D0_POLGL|nr:unnamed protein product [Polarella glacialis]